MLDKPNWIMFKLSNSVKCNRLFRFKVNLKDKLHYFKFIWLLGEFNLTELCSNYRTQLSAAF